MENLDLKRRKAVQKMETLKAFYHHAIVFLVINIALILYFGNIFGKGPTEFNDLGTYFVLFFWGIGLFWHLIYVLIYFFFKNNWIQKWEEKKIRELIEKE